MAPVLALALLPMRAVAQAPVTPLAMAAASSPAQPFRLNLSRASHSHRLLGAVTGFFVGAGATWVVTNRGGSNSLCDRSRNQDALDSRECAGLVLLGGAAGAGLGAIIGGAIHHDEQRSMPPRRLQLRTTPGRQTTVMLALAF